MKVTNANGTQEQKYIYDSDGNRVASIINGVRTNYLVAGNLAQVLMEYDALGQVTANYTYSLGLIRAERGGSETFYHTDGLGGSTRVLTDGTGQVTDRYDYDAYGQLLSHVGNSENAIQFAGEQRDTTTGLDYLRARYYDAQLGRFISKDAFPGYMDDPMSQHDYQYADANPVNFTDPTGYFTIGDAFASIAIAGILASIGGSVGYVGGQYLSGNGPDGEELLNMAYAILLTACELPLESSGNFGGSNNTLYLKPELAEGRYFISNLSD